MRPGIGAGAAWVTGVCTGALLLGAAGLLKGYRSACCRYGRHHLEKFAAILPCRTSQE
jgi:cyclohexyl-isocyanide hydratase